MAAAAASESPEERALREQVALKLRTIQQYEAMVCVTAAAAVCAIQDTRRKASLAETHSAPKVVQATKTACVEGRREGDACRMYAIAMRVLTASLLLLHAKIVSKENIERSFNTIRARAVQ